MISAVFLYGLLLKIAMTASIVVIASVVVERSSPMLGDMIAALPTSGGAAYIILAWENPVSFVAAGAVGGMVANIAAMVFTVSFAAAAQRFALVSAMGLAYLAWFGVVILAKGMVWDLPMTLVMTVPFFATGIMVARRFHTAGEGRKLPVSAWDIAGRAGLVAAFVTTVTAFSQSLGAFLAGVFAFFPIASSSFIVILHRRLGARTAASVAAHMALPLLGLTFAQMEIHLLAERIGVWWSYLLALMICLVWGALLWTTPRLFARVR